MKPCLTSLKVRQISARIAGYLVFFVLSGLLGPQAWAQQVMVTVSRGAQGDPFSGPQYIVFDSQGNLFISDTGNARVRRVDKLTGAVATVAGTGTAGYSGDGGLATSAQINCPAALVFDSAGNLYIADPCSNRVRKVTPGSDGLLKGDGDAGEIITTYAGNGNTGRAATGVPANSTEVSSPNLLAIDTGNNLFIHGSDTFDGEIIRRVDAVSGLISTTDYHGDTVTDSMAFDNLGDLLLVFYNGLDGIAPSTGQLLTGNEGTTRVLDTSGRLIGCFDLPGITFDTAGNAYLSNNDCGFAEIYKITPGSDGRLGSAGSALSNYAGTGTPGYSGDGGPPLAATMNNPLGLAVNSAGNLFIVDNGNNVIRGVINGAPTDGTTTVTPPDQNGNASPVTVTFVGVTQPGFTAVAISPTAPPLPANFVLAETPPVFYDVVTTAQFSGSVTVCIAINPIPLGTSLLHFNQAIQAWEDFTFVPTGSPSRICTTVNSLSPFAIVTSKQQNQAPSITSANNATFQVGVLGSFTVTTTGNPTPTVVEVGALPGLLFVDNGNGTATLSGTPAAGTGGLYPITLKAANGVSPDATQSFTLTVSQSPAITSGTSATFATGASGSFTVTATGFPAPTLSESGALPGGVTFNAATGSLSGTPAAGTGGVYPIVFTAHSGIGADATQSFTLTVNQSSAITSASSATFTVGTSGSFTVMAAGFPTPTLAETGGLPGGVTFLDNHNGTGTLSGTPNVSGTFSLTFTASNGVGTAATQSFTLNVSGPGGPALTVTPTSINFGDVARYHLAAGKVTLQNTGAGSVTLGRVSLTPGAHTGWEDFVFVSLCPSSLGAGRGCSIYIYYFASELGTASATLNIPNSATGSPQSVSLTGTGVRK